MKIVIRVPEIDHSVKTQKKFKYYFENIINNTTQMLTNILPFVFKSPKYDKADEGIEEERLKLISDIVKFRSDINTLLNDAADNLTKMVNQIDEHKNKECTNANAN